MDACLHSSDNPNHCTPDELLVEIRKLGRILLDPCTEESNPTNAALHIYPPTDALTLDWSRLVRGVKGITYCNTPFGSGVPKRKDKTQPKPVREPWMHSIGEWTTYILEQAKRGCEIVQLVPARTGTEWYGNARAGHRARCEMDYRLAFKGAESGAPFDTVLFYSGPQPHLFCHVFAEHGYVEVMR